MRMVRLLVALSFVLLGERAVADVQIDFEGLADTTALQAQYSGVAFSNAIVLTSGLSLNEFEFPPRSGVNVASDDGAPLRIDLQAPALSFAAYFTYAVPLEVSLFDSDMNLLVRASSSFNNNLALSGEVGSQPNELISVSYVGGFSVVRISGSPAGGSFAMDDMAIAAVPEPSAAALGGAGMLAVLALARRRSCLVRR